MFAIISGVAGQGMAPTEIPLERLEAQICEGAAHIAAGMGRWLLLLGEFDRRKGYEQWECRGAPLWVTWRWGTSGPAGREAVGVGRAFLAYPRIAEPLCSGRFPSSRVGAFTRVVTAETEGILLEL